MASPFHNVRGRNLGGSSHLHRAGALPFSPGLFFFEALAGLVHLPLYKAGRPGVHLLPNRAGFCGVSLCGIHKRGFEVLPHFKGESVGIGNCPVLSLRGFK